MMLCIFAVKSTVVENTPKASVFMVLESVKIDNGLLGTSK